MDPDFRGGRCYSPTSVAHLEARHCHSGGVGPHLLVHRNPDDRLDANDVLHLASRDFYTMFLDCREVVG